MAEKVIRITPDGDIYLLTHGDDEILELGEPTIVRASHVRFDNGTKLWYVYLRRPNGREQKLFPGFKKRSDALDSEVGVCQTILDSDPEWVDEVIEGQQVEDILGQKTSG